MKIKLNELNDEGNYKKIKSKNKYDEIKVKAKPTNLYMVLLFSILFLILVLFFIYKNYKTEAEKNNTSRREPGYEVDDENCLQDYTFKAIFQTYTENEKINIINIHPKYVIKMIIN